MPGMPDFKFPKSERLKRRKVIAGLFATGKSMHTYPLALRWDIVERKGPADARAGFAVPRRTFARAVVRNRVRRRMREAYRLNKHVISPISLPHDKQLALMWIYTAKEEIAFKQLQQSLRTIVEKLHKRLSHHA